MQRMRVAIVLAGLAVAVAIDRPGRAVAQDDVIPSHRRIDWFGHTGVPGGIPTRTKICALIDSARYGKGTEDVSRAINVALKNCPKDQVVLIPPGEYIVGSTISFDRLNNVTLRGAGPNKTVLRITMTGQAGIGTAGASYSQPRDIIGGSTKGATALTLINASGLRPGTLVSIYQGDDPRFYWSRSGNSHRTGQHARIVRVTGDVIHIEDPLVWDFSLRPQVRSLTSAHSSWIGIEDLTITGSASYGGTFIELSNTYASWIKNVETAWGKGNAHIQLFGTLRTEIRNSYIHDTHSTTDGYGILTLASSDVRYGHGGSSGALIENNVFSGLWHAIVLETETGTAVSYNYAFNNRFPGWPHYQIADFNANHGPHGMMLLFEGNIGVGFSSDGYHGSLSHFTLFRNWFSGKHQQANRTGNVKLIDLSRFSRYGNVVGNVLGHPGWPSRTTGRYEMVGSPGYTQQAVVYRLGYPNTGNNAASAANPASDGKDGGIDPLTKATLFRWGNFDFQNGAARWEPGEVASDVPVPKARQLTASMLYSSKPAWWPQQVAWPPIGPDVTGGSQADGRVHKLPAQVCTEMGKMPNCSSDPMRSP